MQITNIRNEPGEIIIDFIDVKKIIREYFKQFYMHTFDNLDKMDQFLKKYTLPQLI